VPMIKAEKVYIDGKFYGVDSIVYGYKIISIQDNKRLYIRELFRFFI